MGVQDYRSMTSAPHDGTPVLVLAGSRQPRVAYYEDRNYPDHTGNERWRFWHSDEDCYPDYWTDIPADAPSDYLPQLKALEDQELFRKEMAHIAVQAHRVTKAPVVAAPVVRAAPVTSQPTFPTASVAAGKTAPSTLSKI